MLQLTENKQHGPVLIENFEPNRCARKSAQGVEVQKRRRLPCAGQAAQKVERRRLCAGEPAQRVGSGSRVCGTKKTGRAEALPVWLTKCLQADFTLSDCRETSSKAWWLRASWPSSGFS